MRDQESDRSPLQLELVVLRAVAGHVKLDAVVDDHLAADQVRPTLQVRRLDPDIGLLLPERDAGQSQQSDSTRAPSVRIRRFMAGPPPRVDRSARPPASRAPRAPGDAS